MVTTSGPGSSRAGHENRTSFGETDPDVMEDRLEQQRPQDSLSFTGPDDGWPPQPVGAHGFRRVHSTPLEGLLTKESEAAMREAAIAHEKTRRLLGDRYVHISTSEQFLKARMPAARTAIEVLLVFYSYTHTQAVEVRMVATEVRGARVLKDYEPPEGIDEVHQAVDLARGDLRIRDHVADLPGDAILMRTQPGGHGYGNRLLWVTFGDPHEPQSEKPVRYCAVVDLTELEVVMARAELPII